MRLKAYCVMFFFRFCSVVELSYHLRITQDSFMIMLSLICTDTGSKCPSLYAITHGGAPN